MTIWMGLALLLAAPAVAEPVLHLYGSHDLLPQKTLERFQRDCHCRLEQRYYHDSQEMVMGLARPDTEIDVVFAPGFAVQRLIKHKLLQPLDKLHLPNIANLNPVLSNLPYDPGNRYSLPVSLALSVVGYNIDELKKRHIDPYSWSLIFDPKVLTRLPPGHVNVLDNPRLVTTAALFYLGKDPNQASAADYAKATALIHSARPYWNILPPPRYWKDLVSNNSWAALGFSTDFFQARMLAQQQHMPYTIGYVLQREGNAMDIDNMAIPTSAAQPELALRFINFLLSGKNAARLSNEKGATNPVLAAIPYFHDDIKYHPVINPDDTTLKTWVVLHEMPWKQFLALKRSWRDMPAEAGPAILQHKDHHDQKTGTCKQ